MMVRVPASLAHVTVVASDFARSLAFYDAALGALGLSRAAEFGDEEEHDAQVEAAAWGSEGAAPALWLVTGATPTTGAHVCLRAASRASVEAFFTAATAAGGVARARPRRWPIFRRGEFSAVVADPEGNTVEAVAPE
jgi:catechol 2,3-dioxygenase-like lactoylglutathione lyase family enzyme